jgi:cytochrome c-type biogenesis protein CcmH
VVVSKSGRAKVSWGILLGLAVIAFALLWRFGKLTGSGLELSGAALLLGIAGYAWQGSPGAPGASVAARETENRLDPATVQSRKDMMGQFGNEAQWMDFADTMTRMGQTQGAVLAMRSGIRDNPKSANLWVGLGNALVAHGDGLISPSARFAFQRAAALSPQHPAPPFFLGIALVQQGRADDAAKVWIALLNRSSADAPWRGDVERRLAAIGYAKPSSPAPSKAR